MTCNGPPGELIFWCPSCAWFYPDEDEFVGVIFFGDPGPPISDFVKPLRVLPEEWE